MPRGSSPRPPAHVIGQAFSHWKVLDLTFTLTPRGRRSYLALCRCACGSEKLVMVSSLRAGRSTSCGCNKERYEKTRGSRSTQFTGYEEISGTRWSKIRRGALRRGLPFRIAIEEAWALFVSQGRCCALTGEPLQFDRRKGFLASLDRIDPSKGYTLGNVQWVSKTVNIMRNVLSIPEFVGLCRKVVQHEHQLRQG